MTQAGDRRRAARQWGRRVAAPLGWLLASVAFAAQASAQTTTAFRPAPDAPQYKAPDVSDPLLAPPAPAPREVKSWDDALSLLRAHSPDYIASYESVVRASAQARIALAAVLPTLNAQGSYVHQFFTESIPFDGAVLVAPAVNTFALTGYLQWNLSPRAIYAVGTANRNTEVSRLSFEDRRRMIAITVVGAMLSTLAASRVAELNRVGLRSALERLSLTKTRLQYGQGTPLDVDRADQDAAAARAQIISGDEALRQSREQLGAALGSPVAISAPGDLNLTDFEGAVARTCRLNDDIELRPDVAAARARVEIAERGVTDSDLLYAPTLSLGSTAQAATASTLGPLNTWSVQAAINLPLYDGGVRYGARRDSNAALEQARQALVATRLAAIVSSAQAQRAVSVYEASRDVAKQQRDLADRVDHRTRDSYAQGQGTSLDLVISAQALRQAEINLVLLEVQVGEARANTALTNAKCIY
jgi:multidrug efflux system outer membrane protein